MKIIDTSDWYNVEGTLHEREVITYDPLNGKQEIKIEQAHFEPEVDNFGGATFLNC